MFEVLSYVVKKVREYNKYRHVVAELSRLDDRQLSDIGINRGEIPAVARRSFKAQLSRKENVTGNVKFAAVQ